MSGLEVIGSVASVLQLAATVYSISKTLYEVGDALSNAPSDIKDLARDLETFSEELHLLSTLLDGKNGRYSDRVYRLTAKIIGDCATICQKIDRVLKKLRSGGFLSRLKWVYKEKEIMKLLARLRDLKLSLMGTLSLLSALKADTMMDALGVGSSSLLEGTRNEDTSRQTAKDLEDARQRLAGIAMEGHNLTTVKPSNGLNSQQSWASGTTQTLAISSQSPQGNSANTRSISTSPPGNSSATDPFISYFAMPYQDFTPASTMMMNPAAMDSVQSFHTAISSFEDDHDERHCPEQPSRSLATMTTDVLRTQSTAQPYERWKEEMIYSTIKHFKMTKEEASSWASSLPVPSSVQWNTRTTSRRTVPQYIVAKEANFSYPRRTYSGPPLHVDIPTCTPNSEEHWKSSNLQTDRWRNLSPEAADIEGPEPPATIDRRCKLGSPVTAISTQSSNYSSRSSSPQPEWPQRAPQQMREPVNPPSVKSGSIFTSIDESRSILSQHWASATSTAEPTREDTVHPSRSHRKEYQNQGKLEGEDKAMETKSFRPLVKVEKDRRARRKRGEEVSTERREEPYELEKYQREIEYYDHPESPIEPMGILQRAPEPQQIIVQETPQPSPIILPPREDEYYNRRDVQEFQSDSRSECIFALSGSNRRYLRDSVSGDESSDEDYKIRKKTVRRERSLSHSSRHKRHFAQGALAGAGSAALLANHASKNNAVMIVAGRSRYRDRDDESRSRSSSQHSHKKIKTPIGLATAAAAKYVSNRSRDNDVRSRSRPRSRRSHSAALNSSSSPKNGPSAHKWNTTPQGQDGGAIANSGDLGPRNLYYPPDEESRSHALQDYQMQMMFFEQQNKKNLMMARQEQDAKIPRNETQATLNVHISSGTFQTIPTPQVQSYQKQLMMLEEQNQKRQRIDQQDPVPMSTKAKASSSPEQTPGLGSQLGGLRSSLMPQMMSIPPQKNPKSRINFQRAQEASATSAEAADDLIAIYASDQLDPESWATKADNTFVPPGLTNDDVRNSQRQLQAHIKLRQIALQGQTGGMGSSQVPRRTSSAVPRLNALITTPLQQRMNESEVLYEKKEILQHSTASEQPSQLWWRAHTKLDPDVSSRLRHIWQRAKNGMPIGISDGQIASSRHALTEMDLENMNDNEQSRRDGDSYDAILDSIKRIQDLLEVINGTLGFKVGAFVWVCICQVIMNVCEKRDFSLENQKRFAALADVATIVARYNVMESMYQQWHGMTLESEYEDALILLCAHVLCFLDEVTTTSAKDDILKQSLAKINEADISCRAFTVTFLDNTLSHNIQDLSDEDSDSERTICSPQHNKRKLEQNTSEFEDTQDNSQSQLKRQKF